MDILLKPGRNHARAVKVLRELYPRLEVRTLAEFISFFIRGEKYSVIDVFSPFRPDQEETLRNPTWAEDKRRRLSYRIPSLEEALANKYAAMRTLTRDLPMRLLDVTILRS